MVKATPASAPDAAPAAATRTIKRTELRSPRFTTALAASNLAHEIGSAEWFRGLGKLVGLSGLALALWPGFQPVPTASATVLDDTASAEFRTNTLQPLARGGSMGRRMDVTAAVVAIPAAPERPSIELTATLGQGDRFTQMLQRAGVGAFDVARVAELVSGTVPLNAIAVGTPVRIVLGKRTGPNQPRPLDSLSLRARFDLVLAVNRQGEGLALKAHPIAVDTTPLRIRGTVGSSLYRSARAAGAPLAAVQDYLRTLDRHVSIGEDIMASDEFDFVVSFKRAATGETQVGDLLYAGLIRGGKPHTQLLRWGNDGEFYAVGSEGAAERATAALVAPVAGRITSTFGPRRHPILGFTRMHAGMDFGAPWGAPIHAVTDGAVTYAGYSGGHGNLVKLDHGGGIGTGYAHMSRIAVSPGEHVRRGQVIGYVGSTGLSTGPHLHYELYRNGVTINPASLAFLAPAGPDPAQQAALKARLAQLQAIRPGAALGPLAMR